jgi:hypothetical protein
MKEQKRIQLVGEKTQTKNDKYLKFENTNKSVLVHINNENGIAVLKTEKGEYTLTKHPMLGIHQACINNIKIHLTHKAWVGELIYWA